jgi:uncharacterized protein (TIGR01777 family)
MPALRDHGYAPVTISRRALPGGIVWDPASGRLDPAALEGATAVIHLAGEGIADRRWTPRRKQAIRNSRVAATTLLARTLAGLQAPPGVLISMSAMGIYGDRGDEILTEHSPLGTDYLSEVCQAWEAAAGPARDAAIRVVHPRMGLVLSTTGGALARMLPPFRLGVGGRLGSGHQWMSWIAIDDVVRALLHCLAAEVVSGPVNFSAPHPVTNREFTRILARTLGRPAVIPVPAPLLRTVFGELANATLLASQRLHPVSLTDAGFAFHYPSLLVALRHLLQKH